LRPIIEVTSLGKRYRLGAFGAGSFREEFAGFFRRIRNRGNEESLPGSEPMAREKRDLWALRGVSFEVRRGEIVGIVGLNGAGKSTLLKLLSRITQPTEGEIVLRGRLASLLEVGTGFHPELSGRENVYLSGAILGMTRKEVEQKFDRIVEFSEIGRFIDTPVKRYSSGMYVRLAFSVAAHLEADIMIIDEVLAVGDYAFQAKCIERLHALTRVGKTILLVSHNLYTMQTLCSRGILLRAGQVQVDGSMQRVIADFRKGSLGTRKTKRDLHGSVLVENVAVNDECEARIEIVKEVELVVRCDFVVKRKEVLHFGFSIKSVDGVYVSGLSTFVENRPRMYEVGRHRLTLRLQNVNLCSGSYKLAFAVMNGNGIAVHFSDDEFGELAVVRPFEFDGCVGIRHSWDRTPVGAVANHQME